ncbi:MAG TPA: hypothetical protein VII38_05350 [Polyangia bacterium]|jgi:hypothetical protein
MSALFRVLGLALVASLAVGCASGEAERSRPEPVRHRYPSRMPEVELFFRGDQPYARRGAEEWSLGDVKKGEMVFSPDRRRFAYLRERAKKGATPVAAPMNVIIRNIAGDPVNEFPVYRAGTVDQLTWIDNHRIGYLAPPELAPRNRHGVPPQVYVVHDVNTGEILAARAGSDFIWGPESEGRKHVAFVSGAGGRQALVVDGQNVWPRAGVTHIHGEPVWSPDGHGLAFTEESRLGARLVVLVEFDDAQGDLTWNIPREALGPGLKVFWAGDSKVVIGETPFQPRFAADWKRVQ